MKCVSFRNILIVATITLTAFFQSQALVALAGPPAPATQDVTVTFTPIQAPTIVTGNATNVVGGTARLNGNLTDNGNENPTVWVYYGDTDGATTPASWSSNASLGVNGVGALYKDVSGLLPSTTYYVNFYAVNSEGNDWGVSTNFTTTAFISPPTGFVLADMGAITVSANWTKSGTANYTMLRGSRDDYPADVDKGELIYYGPLSSANYTGVPLDTITLFVSAWGYGSDNSTHSTTYATASIGGDVMDINITGATITVDSAITSVLTMGVGVLLVVGLFAIAVSKRDLVIYAVSGLVTLFISLTWIDSFAGVSIAMMFLAAYQLFQSCHMALSSGGGSRGWSQVKGFYNKVKGGFDV